MSTSRGLCDIERVRRLIGPERRDSVTVVMLHYDEPRYTGFVFPVEKYFPAWALDESHVLVQAGLEACRRIGLPDRPPSKWNFSTNGIYWMGKAGIPSIGFGPGDEETAHTVRDSVSLDDVVKAAEFYALLPALVPGRRIALADAMSGKCGPDRVITRRGSLKNLPSVEACLTTGQLCAVGLAYLALAKPMGLCRRC